MAVSATTVIIIICKLKSCKIFLIEYIIPNIANKVKVKTDRKAFNLTFQLGNSKTFEI